MRAPERRQDEAALERLREHEAALSQRLEAARAEAERARSEAEGDAERLRREERARIEEEVAAASASAAAALEDELRALRDASARAVERVRTDAAPLREQAVACAVDAASGGPP